MKSEFCWNFWGSPNLSTGCDNNSSYVKHVSFKSVIFGRYKMIKKRQRIHAKSLSKALAPSKKNNCLLRWPPVALRCFRIYSRSAHCLPDFCQKGWPLRCCTSIIWSSALVQALSSLSIGRTCAGPRRLPVTEMHFRHFSRESLDISVILIDLLSDRGSVYSNKNLFEILGTPVKTCLICTRTSVKTYWKFWQS